MQVDLDDGFFGSCFRVADSTARESSLTPRPSPSPSPSPVKSAAAQEETDGGEEGDAAANDEGVEGLL